MGRGLSGKLGLSVSLFGLLLLASAQMASAQVEVFVDNFDAGAEAEFSGVTTTESVQSYNTVPTFPNFGGQFLRNPTGDYVTGTAPQATVLTLTDLPPHTAINIKFLLAIIDSWDGVGSSFGPDSFNVEVDGVIVFSKVFAVQSGIPTYTGTPISTGTNLGFSSYNDQAFDMRIEPELQNIPHTADSVVIRFFASGDRWQGGTDESWAFDDFHVEVVPILDADGDGVADNLDNCPADANPDQANNDADTLGDACDSDDDNDAVPDSFDNCQFIANPDQADNDSDGLGDACDADDDNDLIEDAADACPNEAGPESNNGCPLTPVDTDNDGVPDSADLCPTSPGPATNNGCPVIEVVGGEILGLDASTIVMVGAFANAYWIIPVVAALAISAIIMRLRTRIN